MSYSDGESCRSIMASVFLTVTNCFRYMRLNCARAAYFPRCCATIRASFFTSLSDNSLRAIFLALYSSGDLLGLRSIKIHVGPP